MDETEIGGEVHEAGAGKKGIEFLFIHYYIPRARSNFIFSCFPTLEDPRRGTVGSDSDRKHGEDNNNGTRWVRGW